MELTRAVERPAQDQTFLFYESITAMIAPPGREDVSLGRLNHGNYQDRERLCAQRVVEDGTEAGARAQKWQVRPCAAQGTISAMKPLKHLSLENSARAARLVHRCE